MAAMPKRRWSPEQRDEALELYRTDGPTVAAEATGIPKGTIAAWAHNTGAETVCLEKAGARVEAAKLKWEERRVQLAHDMGRIAAKAIARTEHALDGETEDGDMVRVPDERAERGWVLIRPADAKALALTAAILIDKAQLLSGDATSRTEHASDPRARIERFRDDLAERRAIKAAVA